MTTETQTHEAEDLGQNLPSDVINLDPSKALENKVKQEIAVFDPIAAGLQQLHEAYGSLTIAGIDDKEGYKAVKTAWQTVRNTRLQVAKVHKNVKEDYLVITRAIDGKKNEITDNLTPLEIRLKAELDRIDAEKEALAKAEETKKQEELQKRVVAIIDAGAQFTGSFYTIGETISVDVVTLKELPENAFNDLLGKVKAENDRIKKEFEAKQEAERLERERIENQRLENERKQKELEEQQRRLTEQTEATRKEVRAGRWEALENLGFGHNYKLGRWEFNREAQSVVLEYTGDLADLPAFSWQTMVLDAKDKANACNAAQERLNEEKNRKQKEADEQRQKEIEAKAALDAQIKVRAGQLMNMFGMKPDGNKYIRFSKFPTTPNLWIESVQLEREDEKQWVNSVGTLQRNYNDVLEAEAAEQKRLDDQAEAERVAKLGDIEKAEEWLKEVRTVLILGAPISFESDFIKRQFSIAYEKMTNAAGSFQQLIDVEKNK